MSDFGDVFKKVVTPINKDGYFIIGVSVLITFLLLIINGFLGTIGIIFTLFSLYFFRDPVRFTPDDSKVFIAPADGTVDVIEDVVAPKELKLGNEKYQRVSIFLSAFNVHVQRVPMDATVEKTEYVEGKFLNISNDKYHEDNERQIILFKTTGGENYIITQIAGLIARRIVFYLKENQSVKTGDKLGSIKFGSRVDLYLPKSAKIKVKVGQTMVGGETVIANIEK